MALLLKEGWMSAADVGVTPVAATPAEPARREVVFLRLPKNASSSMIAHLRQLEEKHKGLHATVGGHNECLNLCGADLDKIASFRALCNGGAHAGATIDTSRLASVAAATRMCIGFSTFDGPGVFLFAVVRNPFDRAVSSFRYTQPPAPGVDQRAAFEAFAELLVARGVDSDEWNWHERVHLCEQLPHLCVDAMGATSSADLPRNLFVGRFEDLGSTVAALHAALGLGALAEEPAVLPRENCQTPPTAGGGSDAGYRAFYTPRSRECVAIAYRRDIEAFGYAF